MLRKFAIVSLLLAAAMASAQEPAPSPSVPPPATDSRSSLGMSILGNQEAPKSLVIVPWKSSELGNGIGVSRALDTRIRAVDKDGNRRPVVFPRP